MRNTPLRFIICLLLTLPAFAFMNGGALGQCPVAVVSANDSTICAGDSVTLTITAPPDTANLGTPVVNNNGQDGNMFNVTATNTITIRYFEGNIANTPNAITSYYIYYKVGTHVGFESNAGVWTMLAGPLSFAPNAPNTFTRIPFFVNITIPAGQTYAFYLTNTSAITNNNRYSNGLGTGTLQASNPDLNIYEGTGGAYPFGTFFNARPWEGRIIYSVDPAYSWNTGPVTQSITVAPGSTTSYIGTASYSRMIACSSSDTLEINVSQMAVSLGADTTLCQDTLVLDAGPAGNSYLWSTGDSLQAIGVFNSGTYSVSVTDINGCSGMDSIQVTMNPNPSPSLGPDQNLCNGDTATLNTGIGPGYQYQWCNGSTTETIQLTGDGCCTVFVSDSIGCMGMDDVCLTFHDAMPDLGPDTSYRAGSSGVMLDAGAGYLSYAWTPAGSTQTITASSPGIYGVVVIDSFSCTGSDSVSVSEQALPVAGFTDAPAGLVVVFTNTSTNGTTYSWDFGDTATSNLANPSHTYSAPGTYIVTLIATNECGSDTTTTGITLTGRDNEWLAQRVNVFPNPGNGHFTITAPGLNAANTSLQLLNITGGKVWAQSPGAISGNLNMEMDVQGLPAGIYFLQITADEKRVVVKVEKFSN